MSKYILNYEEYENIKKQSYVIKYIAKDNMFYLENSKKKINKLYNFLKNVEISQNTVIFHIDFSDTNLSLKQSDKLVCVIKKLKRHKLLNDKKILVYRKKGPSCYEEFVKHSILLLNYKAKKEKYNYLYDSICDYLDDIVVKNNVCGFENDKCIAKKNTNCTMGCCHHFKNRYFGLLYEKELHLCEYQKDKRCTAKCITCKMYMCDTLRKKGYKFTTQNVLLIKRYFNPIQKLVIITSFFTPKEKIMKRLMFFSV